MSKFINLKINESLTLPTDSYADLIPGEIIMFPVSSVPSSVGTTILDSEYFLECNGDSFSKSNYPLLYDAIGDRFGNSGDNYLLPNLHSSSEDAAIMMRGESNMSNNSKKINNSSETNNSNTINYLQEHNSDHSYTVNSVEVSSFNYDNDNFSVSLNENTQKYTAGIDTNQISSNSKAGYGNKKRGLANNGHTHNYAINSKNNSTTTKDFLKSTSSVNSENEISVSNNYSNDQSNYVFPSIKLKYYIFTGVPDDDYNNSYVDSETSNNYDTKNNATSSLQNVKINNSFKVSSNQVISKPNKIIIYAGQTPPEGYVWCDGNNNTPDLTDRFITSTTSSNIVGKYTNNKSKSNEIKSFPGHSHTVTISDDNITSHNYKYTTNATYNNYGSLNGMDKSGVSNNAAYKGNHTLPGDHFHTFNYSYISNNQIEYTHNNEKPTTDTSGVKKSITITQNNNSNSKSESEFIPAYVSIGFIMKST